MSGALCKGLFIANPNYLIKDCAEFALTLKSSSQIWTAELGKIGTEMTADMLALASPLALRQAVCCLSVQAAVSERH